VAVTTGVLTDGETLSGSEQSVPVKLVDCDVHPMMESPAVLKQFLAKPWHHMLRNLTIAPIKLDAINHGVRVDAKPEDGRPAGSVPALMEQQLLDEAGVDIAIFVYHTLGYLPDPTADAAWTAAINEWQAATWLGEHNHHNRYRGSIRVPAHNPEAAIREIHKWADDERFVQVLLVHGYQPAFGHPMYEPIWRAAAECNLPVAVHVSVGQTGATQFQHPCGHPAYMFEWHTSSYPATYAAHLASLVCNGTLARIPDLRFVMVEGGISWSLALQQHLDNNWRLLRSEVPDVTELPSTYLRRQVLFTTQPVEESYVARDVILQAWQELGAESRVMFSSDYPHWDYDDPKTALPQMPKELRARVQGETARELYGLPATRPATV
jgi:uncharacterized protein